MTKTRSQLREIIRQQIGDEIRLRGTVTNGGFKLYFSDSENLVQPDDYWNGQKVHIVSTTDGNAPQGETRRIADYTMVSNLIVLERPFSATVDNNDVYQISVWSDDVYNQIISSAIKAYSRYRPYKTTGTFSTAVNQRRYDPPAGLDLRAGHRIDEIRYINETTKEDYPITGWMVDVHQNKIDLGYFYSEAKTYTVFFTKPHDDFSDDNDTITIPDQDEELLIKWIRAQFWLLMAKEDFNDFGNIKPGKWTRGQITEDVAATRKNMLALHEREMAEWTEAIKTGGFIAVKITNGGQTGKGEWIPPRDYRVSGYDLY